MFAVDVSAAVVSAAMMFVGATVLTTIGFGLGVTTSPVLLLLLNPKTVVIMINTVGLGLFVLIFLQTKSVLPTRQMIPVTLAGLAGVGPGLVILRIANAQVLSITMAALILALTIAVALNLRPPVRRLGFLAPVFGFVVGVTITSLGIGGPLLALYMITLDWPRHAIRGSLSFYFLVIEVTAVIGYVIARLFTPERITLILIALVPALLGFGLATLLARRMNEQLFRRAVISVIVASSLVVLVREASRL